MERMLFTDIPGKLTQLLTVGTRLSPFLPCKLEPGYEAIYTCMHALLINIKCEPEVAGTDNNNHVINSTFSELKVAVACFEDNVR